MKFSVTMYERDFSGTPVTPIGITLAVARYSFDVLGGPDAATLTARGAKPAISELIQRLRCPIEIHDEAGELVWWGYIHQVTSALNEFEFGASLDSMSNHVAVAYSFVDPGSATVGMRKTTDWVTDLDSVGEYGYKDLMASLDGATDAQAAQTRDLILAQYKYPIATWQPASMAEGTAQVMCKGWWSTLGWRMYANSGISNVSTTTQMSTAITALGQFFGTITIETASGISNSEYQDGDSTLRTVIEDLLMRGTNGGARLTATVTPDRQVLIAAEPAVGANDYQWLKNSQIFDGSSARVAARQCPYGVWVARPDVSGLDLYQLISPAQTFVERAEYDARSDAWRPQVRGIPGPFEIAELVRK